MDQFIIDSVNSQNSAMNELILKIKKHVNEGYYKLKVKDVELDIFDIYEKSNLNFEQFNLDFLSSISEEEKKINYKELYSIYLELKKYEIQDNYITIDSLIDILFKKHIFDYNSKGLMNCFKELPYNYFHKLLLKFKIKTNQEQNLIRIDKFFTILCLLNENFPTQEEISNMIKQIKNKVKYNNYLSKEDFLKIKFWFDTQEIKEKEEKKEIIINKQRRGSCFNTNKIYFFLNNINKKENNIDKKPIKRTTSFKKDKDNNNDEKSLDESNIIEIEKDTKKKLKELLFLINKNYNNDINIYEFFDNISFKHTSKFKRKSTVKIKHKDSILFENNEIKEIEAKSDINNKLTYFEHLFSNI